MSRSSTDTSTVGSPSPLDRAKAAPRRLKAVIERARARWSLVDIVVRTFKRFGDDDGGTSAAALTYYTFFAIFPLLLFAAAAVGYLTFGNETLRHDIVDAAVKGVPMIRDALKPGGLDYIEEHRQAIAGTGLLLALYSGSGVVVALQHALNKIYRVPHEGNWFQKRARSLVWLAILGVTALLSVVLTSAAEVTRSSALEQIAGHIAGFVVSSITFMTAFKFLVNKKLAWKEVLPGAIVAAVAFEILKTFGALYLAHGQTARNDTYGTLAGAATLLVASYLISQITLLSAEVNAVVAERRTLRSSEPAEEEGS